MVVFELNGIEIDSCTGCGGCWFDSGELQLLFELNHIQADPLFTDLSSPKKGIKTDRRCPSCNKKMEQLVIRRESSIVLDRCPRNHGIWFDRGELLSLIDNFHKGEMGELAQFFSSVYHDELKHRRKGE